MKSSKVVVITFVVFSFVAFAAEVPGTSRLKPKSVEKMVELSAMDHRMGAALVSEKPQRNVLPLSSIPDHVKKQAVIWIKRLVKPEWLPPGFETKMVAMKGVVLREHSLTVKGEQPEWKEDYFALDYEIAGYRFHVLEGSQAVSVRIDLESEVILADDPRLQIQPWLEKFLAMPDPSLVLRRLRVTKIEPIFKLTRDEFPRFLPDGNPAQVTAWDWTRMYSDGQFLFVSIPKVESGPYSPSPTVGAIPRF